jgi:Bacteriophage HK97-gp10, putative tail-component
MADALKVDGLAQFSRNLRKLDADLPKQLRVALNTAAQQLVDDARPRIPTRTGKARKSLRAASTRTAVRIRAGGRRAPYYPWLDFGGKVGRNKSVARPFYKDGRFIYKSYRDLTRAGTFQATLSQALLGVVRSAGIEVD